MHLSLSESSEDMSALVFVDVYLSIMLQVKFAANAIFKFCFFFQNKKIEIISFI